MPGLFHVLCQPRCIAPAAEGGIRCSATNAGVREVGGGAWRGCGCLWSGREEIIGLLAVPNVDRILMKTHVQLPFDRNCSDVTIERKCERAFDEEVKF